MGLAVRIRRAALLLLIALCAGCCWADDFALVVSGASGGPSYAAKYEAWQTTFVATLKSFGYSADHVIALADASREQIQGALRDLQHRLTNGDLLLVLLIGHGTVDGPVAKFNLVGPDMTARDWAEQLDQMPGRVVFVNAASGSFPFLKQLSRPDRIVITATDSVAQQFETVFPDFFIKAFSGAAADADKDGRVSIFEAFAYASANVRAWFDRQNRLPTERALLDDDGDGVGREASNSAPDGALAKLTFLQPRGDIATDPLARREAELEAAIADLKSRRGSISATVYDRELERLLTELARVSAQRRR